MKILIPLLSLCGLYSLSQEVITYESHPSFRTQYVNKCHKDYDKQEKYIKCIKNELYLDLERRGCSTMYGKNLTKAKMKLSNKKGLCGVTSAALGFTSKKLKNKFYICPDNIDSNIEKISSSISEEYYGGNLVKKQEEYIKANLIQESIIHEMIHTIDSSYLGHSPKMIKAKEQVQHCLNTPVLYKYQQAGRIPIYVNGIEELRSSPSELYLYLIHKPFLCSNMVALINYLGLFPELLKKLRVTKDTEEFHNLIKKAYVDCKVDRKLFFDVLEILDKRLN